MNAHCHLDVDMKAPKQAVRIDSGVAGLGENGLDLW
jgi:hypothetical protein